MKHALAILATTQNYNRSNPQAAKRIAEIYQRLKENPAPEEADQLLLEALKLKKTPPSEIEQLLTEKLVSNLEQVLAYLEREIVHEIKGPFAFFGHSLGAIIAFELAFILRNKYNMTSKALFLSGSPPPNSASFFSSIGKQDDPTFIHTLQKLNGIPPNLLTSQAFRDFFLPILRNDFSLTDGYDRKFFCP